MARPPVKTSLPPLSDCLPDFKRLPPHADKRNTIAEVLRPVVVRYRQQRSFTFYPAREIADFFGVSLQTATLAMGVLEKEGLLRRIRGSHTIVTGIHDITRVKLRAVAGFPLGWIEDKYSYAHRRLSRELGDELWKHNISLDTIPYMEIGGHLPDFTERIHRHGINFAVWMTPLTHVRKTFLHLEDQGVRNLVIDLNTQTAGFKTQVVIDMVSAYETVALRWRDSGITRVLVIEPSDYRRERIKTFVQIFKRHGFACEVLKSSPWLASEIEATHRKGPKIGIALLDERATAEFTFYEPAAFVALARRHRLLYGNNYPEVPFAGHGETKIDRIFVDHDFLNTTIAALLVRWLNKDFAHEPVTVPTNTGFDVPLWRYL